VNTHALLQLLRSHITRYWFTTCRSAVRDCRPFLPTAFQFVPAPLRFTGHLTLNVGYRIDRIDNASAPILTTSTR